MKSYLECTKDDTNFNRWNFWLCLLADFNAKLWPNNRREMYESGLSVIQACRDRRAKLSRPFKEKA